MLPRLTSGLRDRLGRKASQTRSIPQRPSTMVLMGLDAGRANWRYDRMVSEGYVHNVVAQRAVRTVAEAAASIPWTLQPAGHQAAALLAMPNLQQSRSELVEAVISHLELSGNAYVEVVCGPDGQPAELHALRPDRMQIAFGRDGWPTGYTYAVDGRKVTFAADGSGGHCPILHIKTFNPLDDHYGVSPLQAAQAAIETLNAAARWNKALLDNAARPSGALILEPSDALSSYSAEQFERLRADIEASFSGAQNAGRPLLLDGGLKWQPLSLSPADMDFIAAKDAAAREIALAFGVPPMLLGIPGDNTYANYQEANRALWRLKLLPLLERLTSAFARHLRQWWPELGLDFDREAIPALSADRERLWQQVGAADFLTADERRALLGLASRPGV